MLTVPHHFSELEYSLKSKDKNFVVETIKYSWDMNFIKFKNCDIFQIYFTDDNRQHISIFTREEHSKMITPLEISVYDAAVKRCNEAEDREIEIK